MAVKSKTPWFQVYTSRTPGPPRPIISPLAVCRPELGAHSEIYPIRENEAQGGTGEQDQKQWQDALILFEKFQEGREKDTTQNFLLVRWEKAGSTQNQDWGIRREQETPGSPRNKTKSSCFKEGNNYLFVGRLVLKPLISL